MSQSIERYYIHGDESETAPGTYYCRNCGVFRSSEHFETPCFGENHGSIYARDRERFRAARKIAPLNRPVRPHHIMDRFAI